MADEEKDFHTIRIATKVDDEPWISIKSDREDYSNDEDLITFISSPNCLSAIEKGERTVWDISDGIVDDCVSCLKIRMFNLVREMVYGIKKDVKEIHDGTVANFGSEDPNKDLIEALEGAKNISSVGCVEVVKADDSGRYVVLGKNVQLKTQCPNRGEIKKGENK